jgi:hypothetical protein
MQATFASVGIVIFRFQQIIPVPVSSSQLTVLLVYFRRMQVGVWMHVMFSLVSRRHYITNTYLCHQTSQVRLANRLSAAFPDPLCTPRDPGHGASPLLIWQPTCSSFSIVRALGYTCLIREIFKIRNKDRPSARTSQLKRRYDTMPDC